MITRVYRVTQVLAGASTVARIDGADAEGHALRFEVPKNEAQGAEGRLLVLQWSLHDLPMAPAPEATAASAARADRSPVRAFDLHGFVRGEPTCLFSSMNHKEMKRWTLENW